MGSFIGRRIVNSIFVIFFVSSSGFLILALLPGTPQEAKFGERWSCLNKDKISTLSKYWNFISNFPKEGLGRSLMTGRAITTEIMDALPYSLLLSTFSVFLSFLISFPIGVLCALKKESYIDTSVLILSVLFSSFPVISLGPFLVVIFSVWAGFFPVSGSEGFKSLVLPSLTLSITFSAYLVRIIRKSLIEELKASYIFSLRARGVSSWRIVLFHAFRNSIFPILTVITLRWGSLITGAILTESLFSWPGLGKLLVRSINGRDYNLTFGIIIISSLVYIILNLITDLSYAIFDPKVRYVYKK